jgi:phage baseplate assembly protein W
MPITINWQPTAEEEVLQCVRTILATAPGSVPLARTFGTPQDVVDRPMSRAGALLRADAADAIRRYEPRVRVSRVSLVPESTGRLTATVELASP